MHICGHTACEECANVAGWLIRGAREVSHVQVVFLPALPFVAADRELISFRGREPHNTDPSRAARYSSLIVCNCRARILRHA